MSSTSRTASKGGKAKSDKSHNKADKGDGGKNTGDKQQQQSGVTRSEDLDEKVQQLMEMSQRSEEEVCLALHECDNDVFQAVNKLLENEGHGEWETRVKKKKNRQLSTSKQDKSDEPIGTDDWNDTPQVGGGGTEKDKSRNKSGNGPPRHARHNDSRGWRGREKQENERNLEDGGSGSRSDYYRGGDRRGRPGGSTRGGGGARGRGGGRAGGRYPPRGNRTGGGSGGGVYNKPIDTWDNSNTWDNSTATEANHNEEKWGDFPGTDEWTTEEYTGSLADTKVFTPSAQAALEAEQQQNSEGAAGVVQLPAQSPVPIVGTLNAAQTQYLNQLTQQNSDNLNKHYGNGAQQTYHNVAGGGQVYSGAGQQGYQQQAQQYPPANAYVNNNYEAVNSYGGQEQVSQQQQQQQPVVRAKMQRARVPPPSKIPSSAVEMPGDLNSSIGYLDVQFGALDFIDTNTSYENVNDSAKYAVPNNMDTSSATNLDLNSTAVQNSNMDGYSAKINTQNSSITSPLTQNLSNTDAIPQTSEHLSAGVYAAAAAGTGRSSAAQAASGNTVAAQAAGLDIKGADNQTYASQSATYNSYQPKSNTYNSTTYSPPQTTSSTYGSNQGNNYVNNQSATYNPSSGNSYPNTYSSTASYQANANSSAFPSISQANSYPANNQTYPQNTSQSVYSANTGLSNSNYGNSTSSGSNQYSGYGNSANSHKLAKESGYENSSNASSSSQTTSANVAATTLANVQTTMSSTKSTTTAKNTNSNSGVSNIPPGVAPVMSTPYIMSQVPYFQQPIPYPYEELQLLQQRMPHMTTPYYDMSYQTPTTLAAVRDGSLSNVGYSISDARFTRNDNNASPVPSTLSQQTSTLTQGHQAQPILTGAGPPYFFTPYNTLPNYQFGMYATQLPAATNAHGTSNSTQYPKPATYGSGYGTYDALSQTQDYTKGGYVSNTQGQKGSGGNASSAASSGNDLTAMYGKSHSALGKVNSYDKQGFHSGTPPPFTGALHGNQNAGLAPSGAGYAPQVYIPTMPHQQHHSTAMMHQPLHQDSGNSSGQRSQGSNQAKAGAKQAYPNSYWNQA